MTEKRPETPSDADRLYTCYYTETPCPTCGELMATNGRVEWCCNEEKHEDPE